jgi:hypothetical protein
MCLWSLTTNRAIDLNHTFVTLFRELSTSLSEDDKKKFQDVIDAVSHAWLYHDEALLTRSFLGRRRDAIPESGCAFSSIPR